MRMVTRVDVSTGETLLWCGGADFDIIQAQKKLNSAGMSIQHVGDDKWALVGRMEITETKEVHDG